MKCRIPSLNLGHQAEQTGESAQSQTPPVQPKKTDDAIDIDMKEMEPAIEEEQVASVQEMHSIKTARREHRRSLRASGDYLGVQGANPRTGYYDPSEETNSTELELTRLSNEYKRKIAIEDITQRTQKSLTEVNRKKEQEEAQKKRKERAERKKEQAEREARNQQRKEKNRVRWDRSEEGWTRRAAEPDLSPIEQSMPGSPTGGGQFSAGSPMRGRSLPIRKPPPESSTRVLAPRNVPTQPKAADSNNLFLVQKPTMGPKSEEKPTATSSRSPAMEKPITDQMSAQNPPVRTPGRLTAPLEHLLPAHLETPARSPHKSRIPKKIARAEASSTMNATKSDEPLSSTNIFTTTITGTMPDDPEKNGENGVRKEYQNIIQGEKNLKLKNQEVQEIQESGMQKECQDVPQGEENLGLNDENHKNQENGVEKECLDVSQGGENPGLKNQESQENGMETEYLNISQGEENPKLKDEEKEENGVRKQCLDAPQEKEILPNRPREGGDIEDPSKEIVVPMTVKLLGNTLVIILALGLWAFMWKTF